MVLDFFTAIAKRAQAVTKAIPPNGVTIPILRIPVILKTYKLNENKSGVWSSFCNISFCSYV